MHLEILSEEESARKALDNLLPKLVVNEHTYRIITYQGKNDMLKKLPAVLKGYSRFVPNDWVIIVLMDLDKDKCNDLKKRLNQFATDANLKIKNSFSQTSAFQVLNRIAIEELEAWFLGDPEAIRKAFPRVGHFDNQAKYRIPDSIVDPCETLERILKKASYYSSGLRKVEVADKISKFMQPLNNKSKSFAIFWDGVFCCLNQNTNG